MMLDSRMTITEIAEMVASGFGIHNLAENEYLSDLIKTAVRAGAEYSENIQPEIVTE